MLLPQGLAPSGLGDGYNGHLNLKEWIRLIRITIQVFFSAASTSQPVPVQPTCDGFLPACTEHAVSALQNVALPTIRLLYGPIGSETGAHSRGEALLQLAAAQLQLRCSSVTPTLLLFCEP